MAKKAKNPQHDELVDSVNRYKNRLDAIGDMIVASKAFIELLDMGDYECPASEKASLTSTLNTTIAFCEGQDLVLQDKLSLATNALNAFNREWELSDRQASITAGCA